MKLQLPTRAGSFPSGTARQHTEPAQHGPVTPRAPSHAGALLGLSLGGHIPAKRQYPAAWAHSSGSSGLAFSPRKRETSASAFRS